MDGSRWREPPDKRAGQSHSSSGSDETNDVALSDLAFIGIKNDHARYQDESDAPRKRILIFGLLCPAVETAGYFPSSLRDFGCVRPISA